MVWIDRVPLLKGCNISSLSSQENIATKCQHARINEKTKGFQGCFNTKLDHFSQISGLRLKSSLKPPPSYRMCITKNKPLSFVDMTLTNKHIFVAEIKLLDPWKWLFSTIKNYGPWCFILEDDLPLLLKMVLRKTKPQTKEWRLNFQAFHKPRTKALFLQGGYVGWPIMTSWLLFSRG